MSEWKPGTFPESRPSGLLGSKSGFSVQKFVGATIALAVAGGVGVATWSVLANDNDGDEGTPAEAAGTEGDDPEAPAVKFDVGPPAPKMDLGVDPDPKMDLGGPPKLDIPEPWYDDPSDAPSDAPGPDVEVPSWE